MSFGSFPACTEESIQPGGSRGGLRYVTAGPFTEAPTDEPTEDATPSDTAVTVVMNPDSLESDPEGGPAGGFLFDVTNDTGASCSFAIVAEASDPDALPTTATGEFDRPGGDAYVVAQTPGMSEGSETAIGSDLDTGDYALLCIGVDAEGNGLYGQGIYTGFTVE